MANAFSKLNVQPLVLGGTQISWQVHPQLPLTAPFAFTVEWSRSGITDALDWQTVNSITNQSNQRSLYSVTDTHQRIWSNADRWHYRVTVTDDDGRSYRSEPQTVYGNLSRREYLLAKNIMRKEILRLNQPGVGACGLLFRRKDWGVPCSYSGCLDFDTKEVSNPNCPVCYGTGWTGGYYTPVRFLLDPNLEASYKLTPDENLGHTGATERKVRALAAPSPRTYDFWMEIDSDTRWVVHNVGTMAEMSGYPLIHSIELKLAEPTDVLYTITKDHVG